MVLNALHNVSASTFLCIKLSLGFSNFFIILWYYKGISLLRKLENIQFIKKAKVCMSLQIWAKLLAAAFGTSHSS